jgi:RND family efflux transporter MFP subunit
MFPARNARTVAAVSRNRVFLFLAGCAVLGAGCTSQPSAKVAPPEIRVTVVQPEERDFADFADFTGRTEAPGSVEIRSRVSGYLDKILFKEGNEIKRGQQLFEIDPRPAQAAVNRAKAEVALREADSKYRQAEMERNRPLVAKNAISLSEFDQIVAAAGQAAAAVDSAKAALDEAALNLEFTRILSPIDGETSRAYVTLGNLVKADLTLLTTVVSVDPMYVYFDIDEHDLLAVRQAIRDGQITTPGPDEIPVAMQLANEKGFPHRGIVDFADNRVDPNTGTIRIRGVFPNPVPKTGSRVLIPGLFAKVRITETNPRKVLLVPEQAIGTDQDQKYLLVVNDKDEVEYRRVLLGKSQDGLQIVETGLHAGERVIATGLQRVRPGMKVEVKQAKIEDYMAKEDEEEGTAAAGAKSKPAAMPDRPATAPAKDAASPDKQSTPPAKN